MQNPVRPAFGGLLSQGLAASGSADVFCACLCKPPADRAGASPDTAQDTSFRQHTKPLDYIPFLYTYSSPVQARSAGSYRLLRLVQASRMLRVTSQ